MGTETKTAPKSCPAILRCRGNLTGMRKWVVLLLFLVPLASIAVKWLSLPGADFLARTISLANLATGAESRVGYVLFVPLGAVLVVFFRVTLGIRLLGPFRSILLAIAFQVTGIPLGLFFLGLVVTVIVAIRPLMKSIRLPYFARVSAALSTVAAMVVIALVAGRWFQIHSLQQVAYFPLVVLCLTGDGFAKTLRREGIHSALWRGAMTALVAIVIASIAAIRGFEATLVRLPELLILEIGLIIVIPEFFGFRCFSAINPLPKKKTRRRKSKSRSRRQRAQLFPSDRPQSASQVPQVIGARATQPVHRSPADQAAGGTDPPGIRSKNLEWRAHR